MYAKVIVLAVLEDFPTCEGPQFLPALLGDGIAVESS